MAERFPPGGFPRDPTAGFPGYDAAPPDERARDKARYAPDSRQPEPPAPPASWPPRSFEDFQRAQQAALLSVLDSPFLGSHLARMAWAIANQNFISVALPPWASTPQDARWKSTRGAATIPSTGAVTAITGGFRIPKGYSACISHFWQWVVSAEHWDNLTWFIRVGDQIRAEFVGQISEKNFPLRISIFADENQVVEIAASSNAAADIENVRGGLIYYVWPKKANVDNQRGHVGVV